MGWSVGGWTVGREGLVVEDEGGRVELFLIFCWFSEESGSLVGRVLNSFLLLLLLLRKVTLGTAKKIPDKQKTIQTNGSALLSFN